MINITGFEPLDLILLDSYEKANTIINYIRDNSPEYIKNNFSSFLDSAEIDFFNDLTGGDLARVSTELKKKGLSFNA